MNLTEIMISLGIVAAGILAGFLLGKGYKHHDEDFKNGRDGRLR